MSQSPTVGPSLGLFEASLGAIADVAREAIVMVDADQTIVAVNPAAERLFGYAPRELHGRPLSILIPPASRAKHGQHFEKFAAQGLRERGMAERASLRGLRVDGEEFPAEVHISCLDLPIEGEARRFFVALLRDLTQERTLQDKVDALRRRFHAVVDMAPVAIWIAEADRVTFANQAAGQLFCADDEHALIGRSVYELIGSESHKALRAHVKRALARGTGGPPVEGRIVCANGQVREVEIGTAALPDHGKTVVQMVINDVTLHRMRSSEHQHYRTELQRLSANVVEAREEERRRIARELHDELGQRLSSLKMELSALCQTTARADAECARLENMLTMVDDTVAAVRRISADLRPLMLDDLGLYAAIEALGRDAARRLDIEITVRHGDDEPPVKDSVAIAVYRMVQEALTNVARHAHATDVSISMKVDGPEFVLSVRDNGIGFPDRSRRHDGRFGLLGIRERAHMLGGRLEVDNPAGGGARLTVRLPLGIHATEAAAHDEASR